jgi:hypothetical protein
MTFDEALNQIEKFVADDCPNDTYWNFREVGNGQWSGQIHSYLNLPKFEIAVRTSSPRQLMIALRNGAIAAMQGPGPAAPPAPPARRYG